MVRYNPNDDEPVSPAGRAARSALLRATLGPRSNTPVTLGVRAIRRGWLPLEKVEVATRFPLGLIRAWSVVDAQMAALVYPRPAGTPDLPAAGADAGAEGVVGGKGNEDFAGLRSYRSGDPVRHIHWKAASRSDDLPLKEFSGTVSPDLILNYDEVPGDGESRLSQLTLWALEAEAHGFRYGLVVPGGRVAPSRGDAHLHECLAQLALHGGAQR